MEKFRSSFPVRRICQALGVSSSGHYSRRRRGESARVREDRHLKQKILVEHCAAQKCYGTPRIEQALRRQGVATSRKRVARLRRELGLEAKGRRKMHTTTDSKHKQPVAPNLLQQRFVATRPDEVWVGDITSFRTNQGWLYLAFLMDVFSRRIVGWSVGRRIDEDLTLRALRKALSTRRPAPGTIHHTDQGGQYCGNVYQQTLSAEGLVCSMSRTGNCWDNAMAESLVKTIKAELASWFTSHQAGLQELFWYIEGFYSTKRLHSGIGYRTPAELERLAAAQTSCPPGLLEEVARPKTPEPPSPTLPLLRS